MISKNKNNQYFETAFKGCHEEAQLLGGNSTNTDMEFFPSSEEWNVICEHYHPSILVENATAGEEQVEILNRIIGENKHHGITIAPFDGHDENMIKAINTALEKGIPVITFDSDSEKSNRMLHIGTNNFAFGAMLGKALLQLEPMGGMYSLLNTLPAQHMINRSNGLQNALEGTTWTYFGPDSGFNVNGSPTQAIEAMKAIFRQHETNYPNRNDRPSLAIVSLGFWAMSDEEEWKKFRTDEATGNTTLICADASASQIELLKLGFAHGLVGQVPSEMGRQSARYLIDLIHNPSFSKVNENSGTTIVGTNLLNFLRVPLVLPPVELNTNPLGMIKLLSYLLFGIVAIIVMSLATWTWKNKASKVVRSSQPIFLFLILAGALIMSTTILTMTAEDQALIHATCNSDASIMMRDDVVMKVRTSTQDVACNLNFWFLGIGFTLIFAALFSKTWRLNRIIKASSHFKKVTITVKDVALPLFAMLATVVAVLLTWTLQDPLKYIPKQHSGTDEWNRPISCYGECTSKHATIYVAALLLVACFSLAMALVQAYQTREYRTSFNESNYIGIATVSILQAGIIGTLIYPLTSDQPRIVVPVISLTIFFVTMAVVLFIFIPKVLSHREELASKHRRTRKFISFGAGIAHREYEKFTIQRDLNENSQANEIKSPCNANGEKVEEEQKCEIEPCPNLSSPLSSEQQVSSTKSPSLYL